MRNTIDIHSLENTGLGDVHSCICSFKMSNTHTTRVNSTLALATLAHKLQRASKQEKHAKNLLTHFFQIIFVEAALIIRSLPGQK